MIKEQVMRAIRFKVFGDPSVLELAEVAAPAVDETMAVVRVMAASINPSDVKNVAGAMKQTTLPRIPGRDFAGVVEAGPADWIGAAVWGTGGDTGFTRDGTHAEMIAVPVASLRRKPEILSFDQAASVGVNYMAAWCGLEAAGLKTGETVLLIGAGGGVGGAAAQIAQRLGARVIGAADDRSRRPLRYGARAAGGRHGQTPFRAPRSDLHPSTRWATPRVIVNYQRRTLCPGKMMLKSRNSSNQCSRRDSSLP
jgi:NADPH:quinone reductase-like Zn-dependent oxidoreductase